MAYLRQSGWRIEAHRFRWGRHDVDLVARRGSLVVFVEVKTRRSDRFGSGAESVGFRKRRILTQVAEIWRGRNGALGDQYRFDVILVGEGAPPTIPRITHITDAWRGGEK